MKMGMIPTQNRVIDAFAPSSLLTLKFSVLVCQISGLAKSVRGPVRRKANEIVVDWNAIH